MFKTRTQSRLHSNLMPPAHSPWESQLRYREPQRWASVILFGMLLVGWAAAEYFTAKELRPGLQQMFATPPEEGLDVLATPDPFATCFLLFWLTVWTLGGLMLGIGLLRMLFGCDRICLTSDGLEIVHHLGLCWTRQMIPRAGLCFFHLSAAKDVLRAATNRGTYEVTRMGSIGERTELECTLNNHFGLVRPASSTRLLPAGWCETLSLEREPILIPDPVARRQVARLPEVAFVVLLASAGYLVTIAPHRPQFWTPAGWSIFFAFLSGWAAARLRWTQPELVLGDGRFTFQRRMMKRKWGRFEAVAIDLIERSDGEAGRCFDLIAIALDAPSTPKDRRKAKHRRKITSGLTAESMRTLGQWLSQRCQIPFADTRPGAIGPKTTMSA